jgi:uncharacterized protein YunC (DUF1805 family)
MSWTIAVRLDREMGGWTDGWMDSWMKNTKKILEGRIQGRQTVEKLKDSWINALTKDARKLLPIARWKNWC